MRPAIVFAILFGSTLMAVPSDPQLRTLIDSGSLAELRWQNFADAQQDVKEFYERNSYQLAWVRSDAPTAQALSLMKALESASSKGLDPTDYSWQPLLPGLHPERFDLALTVSAIRYVSDVSSGKVDPKLFSFGLRFDRKKCDVVAALRELVNSRDVAGDLSRYEPPFEGYWRTEKALAQYLALTRLDEGAQLPPVKKPIAPGDDYPGTARLERLLRLLGDLPEDGTLSDALKNFQSRHGLDPDGRIGTATLKELNTPIAQRARQLQLVLERWRWVPHSFARPPIVVNIPEFRLRAYDDRYRPELEMKVVVGKAYRHKTPVFSNQMTHIIFRPYWDVPLSIQQGELVPKIARDPTYLAENEYEIVDRSRRVVSRGAVDSGMLAQLRTGGLAVRQSPGDKNALGSIKFLFPNEYNVYLHATPAKGLFLKTRRDFSHGCIRVEKPEELAQWVLRGLPGWDMDRIQQAESGAINQRVNLQKPIPVLIVYGTAVVSPDGKVFFFDDIYGYDAALAKLLEHGYPYSGWQPTSDGRGPHPHE